MSLKLKIENQIVEVSKRFTEQQATIAIKKYLQSQVEEIDLKHLTLEIFDYIKRYYENNNYEPALIQGGTTNADQLFINKHDKELMLPINPFVGDLLKRLYQAAVYLNMPAFKRLCLARIYYEFQYDFTDPKSLERLLTKFPEVKPLTIKDIEAYKNRYPIICQEFV